MCGGSILSCCPRNPHGHERALKEEEEDIFFKYFSNQGDLEKSKLNNFF